RRLDMVGFFIASPTARQRLREHLRRTPDMERALSRLSVGRGGPRDLAALRDGLATAALIQDLPAEASAATLAALPEDLARAAEALGGHDALVDLLNRALRSELPMTAREGGFIAMGHDPALDEFRSLRDESRRLIAGMESRYRDQ